MLSERAFDSSNTTRHCRSISVSLAIADRAATASTLAKAATTSLNAPVAILASCSSEAGMGGAAESRMDRFDLLAIFVARSLTRSRSALTFSTDTVLRRSDATGSYSARMRRHSFSIRTSHSSILRS